MTNHLRLGHKGWLLCLYRLAQLIHWPTFQRCPGCLVQNVSWTGWNTSYTVIYLSYLSSTHSHSFTRTHARTRALLAGLSCLSCCKQANTGAHSFCIGDGERKTYAHLRLISAQEAASSELLHFYLLCLTWLCVWERRMWSWQDIQSPRTLCGYVFIDTLVVLFFLQVYCYTIN